MKESTATISVLFDESVKDKEANKNTCVFTTPKCYLLQNRRSAYAKSSGTKIRLRGHD